MATFTPDASKPIVWNWINNDLEICPHEIQAAIEHERDCEKNDLNLGFGSTAIGVLSTAALLGLAGVTLAMVPPIALAVAGALHGYNAGIQSRRRELESEFIEDYPDILKAIESKLDQGQSSNKVASAYESIFRLYRRGDDNAIITALGTIAPVTNQSQPEIQPIDDAQNNAESPIAKDETLGISGGQPIAIAQDATNAVAPSVQHITSPVWDPAKDLGENPQSALIVGTPGSGKGMTVSNAVRVLKSQNPTLTVMMIDPKGDKNERGYWEPVTDIFESFALMDCLDPDEGAEWLLSCMSKFQKLPAPKLLIFDELLAASIELEMADKSMKALPKLKKFMAGIVAQGDSKGVWVWAMSQSPQCSDLGLNGGVRGNLRIIAIVSPKNKTAIQVITSTKLVPMVNGGMDELDKIMAASPVGRAVFDGKISRWLPMPKLENHSGFDRDNRSLSSTSPIASPAPIASLSSEERKANIERLQELNEASHDERVQAGIDYEMHDSFDPPRDRLERLWEAAPAETDPAIELINEEQNPSKREALTIAYQWAMARKDKGDSIDRQTFLERARKDRNCEYLRDNRDEIWHCLEALIN